MEHYPDIVDSYFGLLSRVRSARCSFTETLTFTPILGYNTLPIIILPSPSCHDQHYIHVRHSRHGITRAISSKGCIKFYGKSGYIVIPKNSHQMS
jgi:hypothetical protein